MKNIIRNTLFLVCYLFLFSTSFIYASNKITVVDVLDADVIVVQYEDGTTGTVQIAGVISDKSPQAYQHTLQTLLNKNVDLVEQIRPNDLSIPSGWRYAKVRYGEDKEIYEYKTDEYSVSTTREAKRELIRWRRTYWDKRSVNINTATVDEIATVTSISTSQAKKIVEYRIDGVYTYRTLGEIGYIPDIEISTSKLIDLEKYLHVYTDINRASEKELISLFGRTSKTQRQKEQIAKDIIKNRPFSNVRHAREYMGGSYNDIKDFIYVDELLQSSAININTAYYTDLQTFLDISEDIAKGIYRHKGKYNTAKNINATAYKDIITKLSLYTNINTANKEELMLLAEDMSDSIVDKIIEYREQQRFTSDSEVRDLFYKYNLISIYNNIKDYITII